MRLASPVAHGTKGTDRPSHFAATYPVPLSLRTARVRDDNKFQRPVRVSSAILVYFSRGCAHSVTSRPLAQGESSKHSFHRGIISPTGWQDQSCDVSYSSPLVCCAEAWLS